MEKVAIFTKAFRMEPIIKNSLKSVSNQTYKSIKHYIWVSDETREYVEDYARENDHIVVLPYDTWEKTTSYTRILNEIIKMDNADYLTVLDADDILDERFVELLLNKLKENDLDLVFSNRIFFKDNRLYKSGGVAEDMLAVDNDTLKEKFPLFYASIRTVWGTLFKADILLNTDFSYMPKEYEKRRYGGDTQFVLCVLRGCSRIGYVKEELYYYNAKGGISVNYFKGRLDSDLFLYNYAKQFLYDMNMYSERNEYYIKLVLYNAIYDTVEVVLNSKNTFSEKLEDIRYLCKSHEVQEAIKIWRANYINAENERCLEKLIITGLSFSIEISDADLDNFVYIYKCLVQKFENVDMHEFIKTCIDIPEILIEISKGNNNATVLHLLKIINDISKEKVDSLVSFINQIGVLNFLKPYAIQTGFLEKMSDILCDIYTNNKENAINKLLERIEINSDESLVCMKLYQDYAVFLKDKRHYLKALLLQLRYYMYINDEENIKRIAQKLDINSKN